VEKGIIGNEIQILLTQIDGLQNRLLPSIEKINSDMGGVKASIDAIETRIQEARANIQELYNSRREHEKLQANCRGEVDKEILRITTILTNLAKETIKSADFTKLKGSCQTVCAEVQAIKKTLEEEHKAKIKLAKEAMNEKKKKRWIMMWDLIKIILVAIITALITWKLGK